MKTSTKNVGKKLCIDCGGIAGAICEDKLFNKCDTCGSQYPTKYCYDKRWKLKND